MMMSSSGTTKCKTTQVRKDGIFSYFTGSPSLLPSRSLKTMSSGTWGHNSLHLCVGFGWRVWPVYSKRVQQPEYLFSATRLALWAFVFHELEVSECVDARQDLSIMPISRYIILVSSPSISKGIIGRQVDPAAQRTYIQQRLLLIAVVVTDNQSRFFPWHPKGAAAVGAQPLLFRLPPPFWCFPTSSRLVP